jgi:hypothetical protein
LMPFFAAERHDDFHHGRLVVDDDYFRHIRSAESSFRNEKSNRRNENCPEVYIVLPPIMDQGIRPLNSTMSS